MQFSACLVQFRRLIYRFKKKIIPKVPRGNEPFPLLGSPSFLKGLFSKAVFKKNNRCLKCLFCDPESRNAENLQAGLGEPRGLRNPV